MDLDGDSLVLDLDLDVLLAFDSVLEALGLDSDSLSEELLLLLLSFWFLEVDFCFEEDSSSVLSFFFMFFMFGF